MGYEDVRMREYQQCENTNKYMKLRIWGCDVRMRGHQEAPGVQEPYRIREPKDERMWGCEVTSKYTPTWGYEDAVMQARAHKPEDMKMKGC